MKKTYRKNMWRELAANKSRFASVFGIVLLGVMMLSGLLSVAPGMRRAGQDWYSGQNVFDLRVVSTLGLSQEDIDAIAATEGVEAVMPVKQVDCEGSFRGGSTLAVRVQQLPVYPTLADKANMNRLVLESGRMPETAGECVVQVLDAGAAGSLRMGDVIELDTEEVDGLGSGQLTVVGFVKDPLYFSTETESTTAGNGALGLAAYVPDGSLEMDYYAACYIKAAGAGAYDNYSDEYQAAVDAVAARLEEIAPLRAEARRESLIADAESQLADALAELGRRGADAQAQLAEAEAQLTDAKAQLEAGEAEYESGKALLEAQKAALPDNMASGASQLVDAQRQVLEFEAQLEQIKQLVTLKGVADPMLGYAEDILHNAETALEEAEPDDINYVELRDLLARAQALYDSTYNQLAGYQAQLDEGKRQMYAQGLISAPDLSNEELVTEAEAALREMKLQVLEGQLALNTGNAEASPAWEAAEPQRDAARAQGGEGGAEYNDGGARLGEEKAGAEPQWAAARQQLNDAAEQVDDIAAAEWYVLDRGSIVSIVFYEQNADRIESIARVFPIFFLVAALVASTTMTRMVEENRTQMGTFKALGYTDSEITAKYMVYGTAAGLLGCAAGMALGFAGVPAVIWWAYSTVFDLPTFRLRVYPLLAALSVVISIGVVGLTTLAACRVSLKEKPAALLLPRAPAAGKRIFLERVRPLWRRMSFSQKTTARNLFRYKKRFYMTVLGVAGCTALLLIGFGLQDSIVEIVSRQYGTIQKADLTVSLSSDKALDLDGGLTDTLAARDEVESWGAFYTRTVSVYDSRESTSDLSVTLVAADGPQKVTEYFTLRSPAGSELPFIDGSVVLSEKTAELLGVSAGDSIWVQGTDGSRVELTLTGVAQNYLGAYLYVTENTLQRLVADPAWNTVYVRTTCQNDTERETLSTVLLGCNYVSGTSFAADTAAMYDSTITCINYVVLLIIVCAAALAAVVLYNLISVNIGERKKELATIKVLGFFDKEVYRYIFREIELLSVIGAVLGLGIGAAMHQFVIRTVESEQMMFIRMLEPTSFLYSVALTLLFTVVVCRLMRRQVRSISMVESMKAPE